MRTLMALILVLAIPTFATAQQADAVDTDATPVVQLEQSNVTPTSTAPAATVAPANANVEVETRDAPVEDVAEMQEPGTRNWWWVVGAVVVGGLIVVLLT